MSNNFNPNSSYKTSTQIKNNRVKKDLERFRNDYSRKQLENSKARIDQSTQNALNIMSVFPTERLNPYLLFFYFLGIDMRKLGSGASMRQINNYDIEPLIINFPACLKEQMSLVALISDLKVHSEKMISIYKKRKLELSLVRQAILRQACNNKLVRG